MDTLIPDLKQRLWHILRADLATYDSETRDSNALMCCACGRFLPYSQFSLEHIIPQQALADDPAAVRAAVSKNDRGRLLLLCNAPLIASGKKVNAANGCNGWKGRSFDPLIRAVLNGQAIRSPRGLHEKHVIALIAMAYLALVSEFGYQAALTPSGVILRKQFFQPDRFVRGLPLLSQAVLTSPGPFDCAEDFDVWTRPFEFGLEADRCTFRFRTTVLTLPLSRDPRIPIAHTICFVPSKYRLRPDFSSVFK